MIYALRCLSRFSPLLITLVLSGCASLTPPKIPDPFAGDYQPITKYLSAFITQQMKKGEITGLSIALVDDDKLLWSEGFGYADKSAKIKATPETLYRAGSVSKLFNAVAVMQLVEQGKLDLDAPITQYVEDFSINSRFGSIDDITLRSLLSHQSGMPSDIAGGMWSDSAPSLESLNAAWAKSHIVKPANTHFNYSNTGVSLSGLAVQRVTGQPYETYLRDALLLTLNMQQSDFTGSLQGENAAKGYNGKREVEEKPLRDTPAGGLNTTVEDLSRFLMAVHGKGKFLNTHMLSEASLNEMFVVQNDDNLIDLNLRVGLGWLHSNRKLGGRYDVVGHDGRTVAHSAKLVTAPEAGLGVVILSNSADNSDTLGKIAREAMDLLYATKGLPVLEYAPSNAVEKIRTSSELQGEYAGPFNLIEIKPDGKRFKAKAMGMNVSLRPETDNWFFIRVMIGGLSVQPDDLKSVRVTRARIDNVERLIGTDNGQLFLLGDLVEPYPATPAWDKFIGEYALANPLEVDEFNVKSVRFKRHENFYYVEVTAMDNSVEKTAIMPLNDKEFIFLGTGRGMGETVVIDLANSKPVFRYSGLEFVMK